VEIERMLPEGLSQRRAGLDVRFDSKNQLLHRWVFMAGAYDVERLYERDTGRHHRRHLSRKDGDIRRCDAALALKQLALLADPRRYDALPAQFLAEGRLACRDLLAFDLLPGAICPLPVERDLPNCSALSHDSLSPEKLDYEIRAIRNQSIVTRLISSRLVTPSLTFLRPDIRRSGMPSARAWSAICIALPSSMMMRPSVSVTGMTW